MSLISDRPRGATVTATNRVLVIETPRRAMLKLMKAEVSVKNFIDRIYILRALQSNLCPELTSEEFHQSITDATLKPYKRMRSSSRRAMTKMAHLIRSGTVKIIKKRPDGQEYVVTYLHVGSYFGEMALLAEEVGKRNATVAATNVEIIHGQAGFSGPVTQPSPPAENMQRQMQQRNLESVIILEARNNSTA
jgi:CRP-like cAMP-binding protein